MFFKKQYHIFYTFCCNTQSIALLAARYWLFKSFFYSGWLKTKNWDSTLFLFENEYQVPILSAKVAAYLGTFAEISLPIFILIGLFSRVSAFGLLLFNGVILISYPFLWTPDGQMGLEHHLVWGILSLMIMAFGPGKIAIDHLLCRDRCPSEPINGRHI